MKKFDKKLLIMTILFLCIICVSIYFITKDNNEPTYYNDLYFQTNTDDSSIINNNMDKIMVHVDGEVANPRDYKFTFWCTNFRCNF